MANDVLVVETGSERRQRQNAALQVQREIGNRPPIKRYNSYSHCGRLIVLDNANLDISSDLSTAFAIDFPAMPDQIELARKTEYRVSVNMVMPDGIHQYMSTSVMKIPFSFKIHHSDEGYCAEGPLTLLKVAARFHALVTPLGESMRGVQVSNDAALDEGGTAQHGVPGAATEAVSDKKAGATFTRTASTNRTDPPVVVRLELIKSLDSGPGINCTGYVEDVRVILFGPWMRGPGTSQNLPSAAEYSFTFVHRPGHGNFFSNRDKGPTSSTSSIQSQAYAQFIRERLYNSQDLPVTSRWRGWESPE